MSFLHYVRYLVLIIKEFDLMNQVDLVSRFQSSFTCFRTNKMLETAEAKMKFYTFTFRMNSWSEELKSMRRKEQ